MLSRPRGDSCELWKEGEAVQLLATPRVYHHHYHDRHPPTRTTRDSTAMTVTQPAPTPHTLPPTPSPSPSPSPLPAIPHWETLPISKYTTHLSTQRLKRLLNPYKWTRRHLKALSITSAPTLFPSEVAPPSPSPDLYLHLLLSPSGPPTSTWSDWCADTSHKRLHWRHLSQFLSPPPDSPPPQNLLAAVLPAVGALTSRPLPQLHLRFDTHTSTTFSVSAVAHHAPSYTTLAAAITHAPAARCPRAVEAGVLLALAQMELDGFPTLHEARPLVVASRPARRRVVLVQATVRREWVERYGADAPALVLGESREFDLADWEDRVACAGALVLALRVRREAVAGRVCARCGDSFGRRHEAACYPDVVARREGLGVEVALVGVGPR
ncbi:hypothetical protein EDC01DRAFT_778703 [Geopyxis carbonaria]|nr:hypothetical protein EDC01DRAFT_778703 [Geopyxis carbonaria]